MRWQTKDNLESALLEVIGRKELPRKLILNLAKHPAIKLAWLSKKPVTNEIVNRIAEHLMDNSSYRLPHKTTGDIAHQIKTRMRWKQVEKNLSSAQKPQRLQIPARTTVQSDRRPIIPLAA